MIALIGAKHQWDYLHVGEAFLYQKVETIKEAFSRIARNAKEILKKRSVSFREIHDGETQGERSIQTSILLSSSSET